MNVTGSSIPVLRKCQWWARPEVIAPPADPPTEAMALGSEVHGAIENTLLGNAVALGSAEASDLYRTWLDWWTGSDLYKRKWQSEVAYAYNPYSDTARYIGSNMARRYEVEPQEIAGTLDALSVGTEAIIVDWKVGSDFGRMTADAKDNWQLRFYALAVSRAHNVNLVRVMIVRITPDGIRTSEHLLDAMELDAVAEEVKTLVQDIPRSQPQPGSHCRRCRAVSLCPTTTVAIEAIAPAQKVELAITSPEQATALLVRLRQVQAACEQMEAILKDYASVNGGIALPDGKTYKKVPQERESISLTGTDMAAGLAALDAAGVMDAVETKATTTKAAIERQFKAKGLKGKELRAAMDTLLSDLRAAGVMRSVTIDAWRES